MNDRAPLDWNDTEASARTEWLPLSDAQRVVWLDLRLGASPLAYLLGGHTRIDGPLDLGVMRHAMSVLAARHDALRLRVDEDQPRQRLLPPGPLDLEVHTLPAGLTEADAAEAVHTIVQRALNEPLLLGDRPLVRVDLICVHPRRHELLWRFHHLVADSSAIALCIQHWARCYETLASEVAVDLPPGSSFVATLATDQAYAQTPQAEADLAHWRRRFATLPAPLLAPREADATHAPDAAEAAAAPLRWRLEGADYARWRAACTQAGVTEQRALVALLALALGTRHDRRDITLGLALHRRDRHTLQVVGMLSAAMPARCQWQPEDSLRQAVRRIAEQLDQDYRHQRAPMDVIGRALALAGRAQGPLFQASISYTTDTSSGDGTLKGASGVTVTQQDVVPQAIVPLPLLVTDQPARQRLEFVLAVNPAYLDTDAAKGTAEGLQRALAQFCQTPHMPVAELEPTGPAEQALLHSFNPAPSACPQDATLHALVRRQARATPKALALLDGDLAFNYAELDARSDALARTLRQALAACAAPEPVVALALPRSARTVLWLLAILKAGAVYLPLDTGYPRQRLQYLLDDAQAALLVADLDDEATAGLQAPARLDGALLDAEPAQADTHAALPEVDPAAALPADSGPHAAQRLAYIIYTSGSTGLPKPVGMAHRAVVNLDHARQQHDPIGPDSRVLAAISVGFDVSIGQLLLPLLRGAAIVIAPPLRTLQAEAFWALLARHEVTHINSVPSFFDTVSEALQALPEDQRYRGLQRLMLGGEALTGALARKLQQRLPGTQIVNMYGPTETCIDATAYVVPEAPVALPAALPIGRPLPNYRAHILDSLGRRVPIGVTGELCIGGAGLARGYLGRPGATAEKFTADPFAALEGGADNDVGHRLYRTGDLARWRADGQIEFLGRNDQQVKIRGHRIETGEVEAVLLQHPAVAQAAVIARQDPMGQAQLLGYLVARAGTPLPDNDALRHWLLQHLPDPMVPALLMPLPALPLTPNGKLDRRALPVPDAADLAQAAYAAPMGDTETALAALWAELLKRERVGRHDNFFHLGGHSLLAVQLASRLRKRLGIDLPLPELFAQPTLAELAARLDQHGAPATAATPDNTGLPLADRSQPLPLSHAQQRLWFLAQLDADASSAYHIPGGVRLHGALDRTALQAALNRIVARHEVLRTRFETMGGSTVQRVADTAELTLVLDDLRADPDREAAWHSTAEAEATAPFKLQQGPLVRARLLRLADDDHVLLVTMHHIVSDGWSMGVLINEFSALYTAFSQGQPDPLPPLAHQYADYAVWQRQHLAGGLLQRQLGFWTSHLAQAPALLELPTDRPRPAVQDYRGAAIHFTLPESLGRDLGALSRRHGCTLYMVLLAAWAAVLSRSAGQARVVIGTPVANRQLAELEPLIGFFVNTLALQVDLSNAPSVAELLAQVRDTTLAAQAHQDLPFAQLVEALKPPRSLAHSPVFQVMLSWQNTPTGTLSLPGLRLEGLPAAGDGRGEGSSSPVAAKYDLTLDLTPAGDSVSGSLAYATALYDRRTIERHLGHWTTVLQGMVADDSCPVDRLPMLAAAERQQLLHGFNNTAAPWAQDRCVHQLVQAQAARTPTAIALVDAAHPLSYAQLDAQASRLAQRLAALGVVPDSRVAVALPRSSGMVLALLATWKAGGAYVPLDPAYPAERLAFIVRDCAPRVLITNDLLAPRFQQAGAAAAAADHAEAPRLLLIEELLADGAHEGASGAATARADASTASLADSACQPTQLAYVIYTSGSTGQPKGVMVEHRALGNLIAWHQRSFGLQAGQRSWSLAGVGFDAAAWEIWPALCSGATLLLAPGEASAAELMDWAAQQQVDIGFLPTPLAELALKAPQQNSAVPNLIATRLPSRLRTLLTGGDRLSPVAHDPTFTLVNNYGPTETTVVATSGAVRAGPGLPSIGRPIANTRVYVLDAQRQPVPIGVTGELYIGGAGVARGYLNQPQLSAERFLADPFAPAGTTPGRMYRSGDLVRWRADGQLDFVGRNDQQVKIRGQRIELGEIEARLLALPGVREAAVLAHTVAHTQDHTRTDGQPLPSPRLVAYVAGDPDALAPALLREQLAAFLPEHMLPAAFVPLPQLPLTANGKVDRAALPALNDIDVEALAAELHSPPQGETETRMAAVWAQVLGVPQVGRDDNFFDLGGHSLLAIGLIEQLRQAGLAMDVATLFAQPTLRGQAAACDAGRVLAHAPAPAVGIPPGATRITPEMLPMVALSQAQIDAVVATVPGGAAMVQDIYPLAPLQEGMLFHHLKQARGDVFLMPVVFGFDSQEAVTHFIGLLQQVVARHDILRTSVAWRGLPEPVQVVWREARLVLETLPGPGSQADALEALKAQIDPRQHRLELGQAPLMRALAMPDAPQGRWLLALCLHHLALDHTSMDIVLQEVSALRQGQPLPPALPFRQLLWQARQGVSREEHEAYFHQALGDVEAPTVPYGLSQVQGDAQGVREAHALLPADLAAELRAQARAQGVSTASLMHLAWGLVLAATRPHDGPLADDVVFGTVLFGRMNAGPGADRALGMLINTLPLRLHLGAQGVASAAQATQDALRLLMRHEHAPLSLAQRCSGVHAPTPLFTALFNYRYAYAAPVVSDLKLLWGEERTGYPLALAVDDDGSGFGFTVQALAPVEPQRVARLMARAVEQLVAALRDAPHTPCAALDLVDEAERALQLQQFNPPAQAWPRAQPTLHEAVRAQVRATPQALAVVDGEQTLSYAELDARSDVLARRIRAAVAAAGPEPVVGVALPRSADTVVALLAILKAQAVYLPLDTAYPPARLQYMLDDARAALLIDLPGDAATAGLQVPRLADAGPTAALPAENDPRRAQRLAYVIYTSGSTGLPKPVGMGHGAAVNLAHARQRHDPLGLGDRVLAAISVGFDVSIGQLLLPLLSGAAIVIAPPLRSLQAQDFWALLRRHAVTHINSVPSFFETVSQALPPEGHRGLKRLMLGGEALTGALARQLQQRLPGTQIVNMYGPTETCIDATAYVVPDQGELPAALPIGQPLPNYRAYVLDPMGRLLPTGVVGELCIAGAGLARGYLGRPAATAEKFVADPYGPPGSRMYRSGDLARWTADGQIEFLGRNDQQVKIRGHRIETGEVEAALLQQPSVAQAAVIARKDAAGQNRLLAYVVARGDATQPPPAPEALRATLASQLPEHMLPSAIVWLPALPLTANGKLDLRALPDAQDALQRQAVYAPPQGEAETLLAALWCELLKRERVGRDDDFFALGGQSLVAITLAERLRQAGWQIAVAALFERPTLRAMAAACVPLDEASAAPAAPPVGIAPGATHITPEMLPMVALSQAQIDSITAAVPGGAAQVQDIYPLAPLQQGMLYHHLLQPVGDVYLTPMIAGFPHRAALDGFVQALQQVMARHDILRTAIAWEGLPEPVQVVWREATLSLEEAAPPTDGSAALAHLKTVVDPRVNRIDLRRAPLLRAVALHDAADARWLLALCLHHLTLDHRSMEIVMQEVGLIQQAAALGHAPVLPPAVPFREMVWQARQGQDEAQHQAYFERVLGDVTAPTAPFGLAEVRSDADGVGQAHRVLPAALAQAVREQARSQGVSAAALLHLAWGLVLARCSEHGPQAAREDVVFGTVLFGRMGAGPGADRALGMLINTLPLRLHLGQRSVAEALQATHEALHELMRHEHAALALAQRCSGVAAPAPLFTALFNLRHDEPASLPAGDSAADGDSPASTDSQAAGDGSGLVWAEERTGYPLALAVNDDGSGYSLDVQAQAPVDPELVAGLMAQALAGIVGALQAAPQTACDALDILPPADRQWLLAHSAPMPVPDAGQGLLHDRVRRQARLTPDAPAVVDGPQVLGYAELDARSDALACAIRAALAGSAQPEPVVALALPRSLDTVVYLLAILKAGAVYLPLDTAYPTARLQYLLDDAGAALLIDHGQAATAALRAPRLQADGPAAEPLPDDSAASPERLAYVIYTSGSTGLPKPVGVSHRAATNLALARQVGHDPIGPGSRVLAAISVGFDVSIGQLLLPLLQGAAIVIAPPLQTLQPEAFWALLAHHGVTHINSVPSFFDTVSEALVALPENQRYRGLKRLMLGGEVLTGVLARKLQQRLPGTQIVNMYGPTEACIDATAFVVPMPDDRAGSAPAPGSAGPSAALPSSLPASLPASLPIGRPLANYRAYVLDAQGRLLPPGVTGELCLAGPGLARGYLGRPEATAEKFVADPHGAPGERMYRTGDLARWQRGSGDAPGQIEFLGRQDQQVKIRGFRVETGEIEAALLKQPGVLQAAVVARRDASGQMRLVAYLVGPSATASPMDALKAALAAELPEHMLPSALVSLPALPLTANGKLDARALPEADLSVAAAPAYVAPRDAVEALLQPVWQAVLGQPRVGMADDFFALGGHSLLAMRLVTACQQALRGAGQSELAGRVSLRMLLSQATLGGLAAALQAQAAAQGLPAPLVLLRPAQAGRQRAPIFCVHPQSGTTWCYGELARRLPVDVAVYGLDALGLQPGEAVQDQIEPMAQRYLQALRQVQPQGPYQLLGYSSGGVVVYEMARQLQAEGQQVSLLALLDSPLPGGGGSGQAAQDYTEADVLDDNRRLLGLSAEQAPRNAHELQALLRQHGLVAEDFGVVQAQRMIDTSRGIVQAVRRYQPPPGPQLPQQLVQVHALQREGPLADWSALAGEAVQTHALDCDHVGLIGARWAPVVAELIAAQLG